MIVVVLFAAACADAFQCTLSIDPAIVVAVTDSLTGEPAADSAFGPIRDGSYIDSLQPSVRDGEGRLTHLRAGDEL